MSGDPHKALGRALTALGLRIESSAGEPWASNTYSGERHRFAGCAAASVRAVLEAIGEAEFSLPGHIVADIVATVGPDCGGEMAVTIKALTLEDW